MFPYKGKGYSGSLEIFFIFLDLCLDRGLSSMSHSIMLKIAMRRSYQRNYFYRLRKNFIAGIIFTQEQIKTKDSIAVNML
jgi:hypothetical protein